MTDRQRSTVHYESQAMKNLELLYAQIQDRGMSWDTYLEKLGEVLQNQKMFTLTSSNNVTGMVLKSEDGTFHVWFVTRSQDNSLFYVTEESTHYPHQLGLALESLANRMHCLCSDLIESNGQ